MDLAERNKGLIQLRNSDPLFWTFKKLGEQFDISRQRADQIYRKGTKIIKERDFSMFGGLEIPAHLKAIKWNGITKYVRR